MRAAWLLIEVPYLKRFRICGKQDWDKHSGHLWDLANALEPIGLYRMNVEEEALRISVGQEYLIYQHRTCRLIPKVY